MDPQTYIELPTNIDVAKFEQWLGREYVRDQAHPPWGDTYPLPPDTWDNTSPPWDPGNPPPPEGYTWFDVRAIPMAGNGGVIVLTDEVVRYATQTQTLTDGTVYSFDIAANAKTIDQLSPAGQVAATPPSFPGG